MKTKVQTPVQYVRSLAKMKFPPSLNDRLGWLMDRNNDGLLTAAERRELKGLAELSETMSLFRAEALQLLGRKPA